MNGFRVLRRIRFNNITADDALLIRLHVNIGDPVKVSDYDYDGAVFDSRQAALYELRDIDLRLGQVLDVVNVQREGFRGIDKYKKTGYVFCYVLEDEINGNGEWIMPHQHQ